MKLSLIDKHNLTYILWNKLFCLTAHRNCYRMAIQLCRLRDCLLPVVKPTLFFFFLCNEEPYDHSKVFSWECLEEVKVNGHLKPMIRIIV